MSIETLIVGAGQAGLTMSHQLRLRGRPHLVLERGRIAERWHSERWDGMHFQTPNDLVRLPDFPLDHPNPAGFATSPEIAAFLTRYAATRCGEIREGVTVERLRARPGGGFIADTSAGMIESDNAVIATGPFQRPAAPPLIPADSGLLQLHASAYKNPGQLPEGAVLVVGAGASGAQIAHELMRAGRRTILSVSRHRRAPRRYRGHDHIWWWIETGMDQTPVERRPADRSPLVHTGAYGGQSIDFREFAAQGMVLTGKLVGVEDGVARFADDLIANIAHGDAACAAFMDFVDAHIARKGMDLPLDPVARAIPAIPESLADAPRRLDLRAEGAGSVVWATGYTMDFSWIGLPVLDSRGMPVHRGGVTDVPGLYFLGLPFLTRMSSSFLFGVGQDAAALAVLIGQGGPA